MADRDSTSKRWPPQWATGLSEQAAHPGRHGDHSVLFWLFCCGSVNWYKNMRMNVNEQWSGSMLASVSAKRGAAARQEQEEEEEEKKKEEVVQKEEGNLLAGILKSAQSWSCSCCARMSHRKVTIRWWRFFIRDFTTCTHCVSWTPLNVEDL